MAWVIPALAGCGTLCNLQDSPGMQNLAVGTGACYPFGGAVRSGLLAVMGPPSGLEEMIEGDLAVCRGEFESGFQQIGRGVFVTSAGVGAIVDVPLSLAGDILTLPIAYARSKEYRWATWWGEKRLQPKSGTPAPETDPDASKAPSADRDPGCPALAPTTAKPDSKKCVSAPQNHS
jgi:hypothetical protein